MACSSNAGQRRKAVAEFQGVQFMLADMAMKLEAARQLTYAAAARSERGDPDLTFFSAAAKCFASDTAMEVTIDAVQLLGEYGYTRDFPAERMMRDAKITQIYEDTNQVQRVVLAAHVEQLHGRQRPAIDPLGQAQRDERANALRPRRRTVTKLILSGASIGIQAKPASVPQRHRGSS